MKGAKTVHGNYINGFSEKKNSYLNKWAILGLKMWCFHNFESAVRIFLKFEQRKGSRGTRGKLY